MYLDIMKSKTLTINIREDVEKKLRQIAAIRYGKRKGYLGKTISDAVEEWAKKEERENVVAKSLKLLETGIGNKQWKFNREEIYDERFRKLKK